MNLPACSISQKNLQQVIQGIKGRKGEGNGKKGQGVGKDRVRGRDGLRRWDVGEKVGGVVVGWAGEGPGKGGCVGKGAVHDL
jgi:hypothetical protein